MKRNTQIVANVTGNQNLDFQPTLENVNKKIENISGYFDRELETNEDLQNKVAQQTLVNLVVNRQVLTYKQKQIKIETEVKNFLKMQVSEKTRTSYKNHLTCFLEYLNNKNLDFRTMRVQDVDTWLLDTLSKYSSRTARLKLATVSSFYKFLQFRYIDVFPINIFHNRKLPPISDRFKKDYVTDNDIIVIKEHLRFLERFDVIVVVDLLLKYGFRIGVFQNMEINSDNTWESVSKGEQKQGKFTKREVQQIKEYNIFEKSINTFQTSFSRLTRKLFETRQISCKPSLHDLRRKNILDGLIENNGIKFVEFSKKLHKNPMTTFGYIQSYKDR